MKAVVKTIRISPKKLNLVAELVRGKEAAEAMEILEYTPKKGANILHKALKSAMANATNNFKQEKENLVIQEILVSKASTYKRWLPASRGRVNPILKRNSHLTIKIGIKDTAEEKKPVKKAKATEGEPQKTETKEAQKAEPKKTEAEKSAPKATKTVKA